MTITASKLRQDVYRLLDQVLETGCPLEVERKGRRRIVPAGPESAFDHLPDRGDYLRCDPDELIHLDRSGEWKP